LVAKGIDLGWVLGLAKLGALAFCALVAKLVKIEVMVFEQSLWASVQMYAK